MADYHRTYRLDPTPIATGGQATVTRAVHRRTGQECALKVRGMGNAEAADRMRREIDVQSSIEHPHVMPILDRDDAYSWFTMPLAVEPLNGISVPIGQALLKTILTQTIDGLQAAHERGFVHRDIKPSNILRLNDEQGGPLGSGRLGDRKATSRCHNFRSHSYRRDAWH